MWQNWVCGILGLWIVLVVFLGFSSTLTNFFLIVSGLAIVALGFWTSSLTKPFFKNSGKNSESEIMPASTADRPVSQDQGEIIPPEKGENGGENNAL